MINQIHGHLREHGAALGRGESKLKRGLVDLFSDEALPTVLYEMLLELLTPLLREEE